MLFVVKCVLGGLILRVVFRVLFTGGSLVAAVRCCCSLCVEWCLLWLVCIVCCLLAGDGGRCELFVALRAACCSLYVACCVMLFVLV